MITWILSQLFCHYWEVTSWLQTPQWKTHFLTKKEAYEYADKNIYTGYTYNSTNFSLCNIGKNTDKQTNILL